MKKNLILFMSLLAILTGCQKNIESGKDKSTTPTTTITSTMTMNTTIESVDEVTKDSQKMEATTTKIKEHKDILTSTSKKTEVSKTTKTTKSNTITTSKKITTTTKPTTTKSSTTSKATTKSIISTKPTTTTTLKQLTEKEVYSAMISLKKKYPTGTPWSNSNYYDWKGGIFTRGYGCAGFAFMLSDAAFGSVKAKKVTNFDNVRVGDIIRMNGDTHSVIVLTVSSSSVTVAEGNMTVVGRFENGVYWGRKITLSELKSSGDYILTRW